MKRILASLTMSTSALLVTGQFASAGGHDVSTGDLYSSCLYGADAPGGPLPAVVFSNTEPEVWLSRNPATPSNYIGAIQQDRWYSGGARGLAVQYSRDSGDHWSEAALPFSVCALPYDGSAVITDPYGKNEPGAEPGIPQYYDRASDPWVSIGPDGTAYTVSISFDANDNGGAVGAATSSDGGQTWGNAQRIIAEDPADPSLPFNDKESVTADPTRPGHAYVVWDRLQNISCGSGPGATRAPQSDDSPARNRGGGDPALNCFDGPAMISETANHGQTWSTPRAIVPTPTPNTQTLGNEIVVGPTGTLYDFFTYVDQSGNYFVKMVSSPDGTTWSAPVTVNSEDVTIGVNDPRDGAPLRTGAIIPQPAVDPHSGQLYVVWEDNRDNTTGDQEDFVLVSTSTDGGTTWATPALVNDPKDIAAFTPAIAIRPDGSAVIQFYAFPNHLDKDTSRLPTTLVVRATNGPGTSFTHKEKNVDGSFNSRAAPFAIGGYFTGDYEGLALGKDANSVQTFADETTCNDTKCDAVSGFDSSGNPIASNAPNPTDTYSERVNPS